MATHDPCAPFVWHYVTFSLDIVRGSVVKALFASDLVDGIKEPVIKLIKISNGTDLCIEHREDPIRSFATRVASEKPRARYGCLEHYQKTWLPILAMEAVSNIARNEQTIVCRNVEVEFFKRNEIVYGKVKLDKQFWTDRQIDDIHGILEGEYSK